MRASVQRRNNIGKPIPLILFASLAARFVRRERFGAARRAFPRQPAQSDNRLTSDLNGSIAVHDGDHIKVKTDLGNIAINTQNSRTPTSSTTAFILKPTEHRRTRNSC